MKWWPLIIGAAGVVVLLATGKKAVSVLVKRKRGVLTDYLLDKIRKYSQKHGVPLPLVLATIDAESGFNVHAYNPNCAGETKKQVATEKPPYWGCQSRVYGHYNVLVRRAAEKDWFTKKWNKAVDRNRPGLWGAVGLMQIMPDVAWGYGWSPEKSNLGLFDVDVNLDIGIKILAARWKKFGNATDVRASYYYGGDYGSAVARHGREAVDKRVGRFFDYLSLYEEKFGGKVRRRT